MAEHLRTADESEPAATGTNLSQAAVDLGATALRETGLADLSPVAVAQVAQLLEAMGRSTTADNSDRRSVARAVGLVVAVFFAVIFAAALVAGVMMVHQRVSAIEHQLDTVEVIKARQDALVLHLLASVQLLADAQSVELPRPPAVLRIAEAQAAQAASQ